MGHIECPIHLQVSLMHGLPWWLPHPRSPLRKRAAAGALSLKKRYWQVQVFVLSSGPDECGSERTRAVQFSGRRTTDGRI